MSSWKPKYSGPNRSGVCICGCPWDDHHLGFIMNEQYREQTGEIYGPGECERYGFNETAGLKYVNGEWVDHCHQYVDAMEKTNESL